MTLVDAPSPTSAHAGDPGADAPPRKPPRPWQTLRGAPGDRLRIGVALLGLACVATAEGLLPGTAQEVLATAGVTALAAAGVLLLTGMAARGREPLRAREPGRTAPVETQIAGMDRVRASDRRHRAAWRWTLVGAGLCEALVVQTWFRAGTAIAGGDIGPPLGTAWVARLFAPIAWSGSNLGGVNQQQLELPWAAVVFLTHLAGGSGALAQRIWLTGLLAAVPVAAAALARALGLSPLAGVAAALLYAFSPYLVSIGGVSDVYLVAMFLLAALPAVVVAAGRGTFPLWLAAACFILTAPFLGYAYANPPLVGMIAGIAAVSPGLAWLRYGRLAAARSAWALLVGGALLVGASAYWVIPSRIAIGGVATASLSALAAWVWTESRATLANALWLNTSWSWRYTYYVPYAPDFSRLPLVLVRPLLPLVGFGVLALPAGARPATRHKLVLTGAVALGTLVIIVVSTGTRAPGNVLFDPLYSLPYGWLLREPGRFLLAASLGVALLGALLVDGLQVRSSSLERDGERHPRRLGQVAGASVALAGVALVALGSFPLWSGAVVPGPRPPFPSSHVRIPAYWTALASYLNGPAAPAGHLLALPPDDSIYMPYSWYYGNDGFVTNLLSRPVVDPTPGGYFAVSGELLAATRLEASALVARSWSEARRLLGAIGTPLVLVRGDIEAPFPGHSIVPPPLLSARLREDPLMRLVHTDGPLAVYEVRQPLGQPENFATVNTAAPDLRVLSALPAPTALVTSSPVPGRLAVFQLPPVADWLLRKHELTTVLAEQPDRRYVLRVLGLSSGRGVDRSITARVREGARGSRVLQLNVPIGPSIVTNGAFRQGLWGPVGNCNAAHPVVPPEFVTGSVLPVGGPARTPALRLAADTDGACEAQTLAWKGGALLLRVEVRHLAGASPQLCLWEEPEARCAPEAALPSGAGWQRYSAVVVPSAHTTSLSLFLYALSTTSDQTTVNEYADLVVRALPAAPQVDVFGMPTTPPTPPRSRALVTTSTGFDAGWSISRGGRHVEVDGLRNGWIVARAEPPPRGAHAVFLPTRSELRDEIALAGVGALTGLLLAILARRRPRSSDSRAARPAVPE